MPCNGTEGARFHEMHCANCERDKVMNGTATIEEADGDATVLCDVLSRSFVEETLPEWKFGPDGWPMCMSFVPMGGTIPAQGRERTDDLFGCVPDITKSYNSNHTEGEIA